MLGFGVDAAMVLMTPVVLQVAKDVIGFLGEQLRERAREQGEGAIDRDHRQDREPERRRGRAGAGGGAHGRAAPAGARRWRSRRAGRSSSPTSEPHCSRTRSSGVWRRHERRGGRTGAPSPPESVRLPVRHRLPVRAPRRSSARGKPLRLAVDRLDIPEPGGTRRRHARVPRPFSEQRHEHRAAERTHRQVLRLYLAALPLPGVVDARRYGGTAPRRCRDHGRDAPLDHAAPQAAAADGGGCAGRPGGGCGARPRAGTRSTAALLESARRVCRRPCIRASGPVQRRDWRGARREARRRPARVQSCRPARARAHPQPRRRDHVLHARGLVRVPPASPSSPSPSRFWATHCCRGSCGGWPYSRSSST